MIKQENAAESYTLKRWRVVEMPDGLSLEGRLQSPAGDPEGLQVSTSFITDWSFENDTVYFKTKNSVYCCALSDYAFDGSLKFIIYCSGLPEGEILGT